MKSISSVTAEMMIIFKQVSPSALPFPIGRPSRQSHLEFTPVVESLLLCWAGWDVETNIFVAPQSPRCLHFWGSVVLSRTTNELSLN